MTWPWPIKWELRGFMFLLDTVASISQSCLQISLFSVALGMLHLGF